MFYNRVGSDIWSILGPSLMHSQIDLFVETKNDPQLPKRKIKHNFTSVASRRGKNFHKIPFLFWGASLRSFEKLIKVLMSLSHAIYQIFYFIFLLPKCRVHERLWVFPKVWQKIRKKHFLFLREIWRRKISDLSSIVGDNER